MIYKVKAKLIEDSVDEFFSKLTDGTIANQRPDGGEIVASMKRAVRNETGMCEWYEMCLCPTPLLHERATQFDFHFTDITTEVVDDYGEVDGESLWSYMKSRTSV